MPEVCNVGAWITTPNGAEVEEYGIELADDKTMLCYIPSEENKVLCSLLLLMNKLRYADPGGVCQEFMVRVKSELDGLGTMLFRVSIDGHSLAGQVCGSGAEKYVDGVSVSNTLLRPFKFASWSAGTPHHLLEATSPLIRNPIRGLIQRMKNPKSDVARGSTSG